MAVLRSSLATFAVILLCLFVSIGCNRNLGPVRYDLTGKITYGGKPVPAGYILFSPDKSKGNDGPGADAEIKNGVYKVRTKEGTIGGPHIATVSGFDGVSQKKGLTANPMGLPIFQNIQVRVDLPKKSTTYDIVVPTNVMN